MTESHKEFRSVSMGAWIKAGTRHERSNETGISHFLEHMLFKGTSTRNAFEIARSIDQVGGDFNAFTAREYTCFHLTLLNRDVGLGVDILSDIILDSKFDTAEMERERKVILQEIAMVEESPEELVHDIYFELIYGRHGLGKPILGTESSIRRLRRSDLLRYYRKHYRPDQVVISVSGDISHEQMQRRFRQLGKGQWPGRPKMSKSKKEFGFEPAPAIKKDCWWVKRPSEQVHIVWGMEGPRYSSRDRFVGLLLNVYLGGGMSSALFQEIREKNGLAYTVYSSLSPFIDSGIFSIYVATGMNQIPLCLKLIDEAVGRLCKEQLSEEELDVIKNNLKGTILLSADGVESRMSSIAKNDIFLSKYVGVEDICKVIDSIRPADIRRLVRKMLSKGEKSILVLGPKPSKAVAKKLRPRMLKR